MIFWIGLALLIIGLIGRSSESVHENDRKICNTCFNIGKWILIIYAIFFVMCVTVAATLTALGMLAL